MAVTIDFLLGMNAKLYWGAADTALASMSVAGNVKDLSLKMTAGEADITTRGNSGWKATAPTLREATLTFKMVWKSPDTFFSAIKAAFLGATTVGMAPLTGAIATAGSEGPIGNWSITEFSRDESLEEAIVVDVTAKLAKYTDWAVDGVDPA